MNDLAGLVAEEAVKSSNFIQDVVAKIQDLLFGTKVQFDDSAWDGSASRWDTPEAYCSDCLIDLNPSGQPKTKDKCKLPYRSPGSSKVNLGALRAIASGARGLSATNAPPEAKRSAAKKVAGWWRSAFKKDPPPSIAKFLSSSKVSFFKDKEGQWWFFGIYSNKYQDLDGEFIPEADHEEYASWIKELGFKPMITLYHQPKMPVGFWQKVMDRYSDDAETLNQIVGSIFKDFGFARAERITYFNGFATVLAKVVDGKEAVAEKLSEMDDLGMSHGFVVMELDGNVLHKYRSFEMSVLKRDRAANFITSASLLQKEDDAMAGKKGLTGEDRALLENVLGKDIVSKLETDSKALEEALDGILEFKDAEDPSDASAEESEVVEEAEAEDAESKEKDETPLTVGFAKEVDDNFQQIGQAVNQILAKLSELEQNQKTLAEGVEKELKDVKQSEDEKIASLLTPLTFGAGYSPSKAKDNEVNKEEADEKKKTGPTGENGQLDPNDMIGFAVKSMMSTPINQG